MGICVTDYLKNYNNSSGIEEGILQVQANMLHCPSCQHELENWQRYTEQ
jgi:hypothetical protein